MTSFQSGESICGFYNCFILGVLLLGFFPEKLFRVFHHCFVECFIALFNVNNYLCPNGHLLALSITLIAFYCVLSGSSFCCCCCTANATDLREHFLPSGIFHLTLLPPIRCKYHHNLVLSRFPWELVSFPWRLQGLPQSYKTQKWPICLFESHSVQQKLLLGRFYLRVKASGGTLY